MKALDENNFSLYKDALAKYQKFIKEYPNSTHKLTGTIQITIYNQIAGDPELATIPFISYGSSDDTTKIYIKGWNDIILLDNGSTNYEAGSVLDFVVNYKYSISKQHKSLDAFNYDDFTISNLIPGVYGFYVKIGSDEHAYLNELEIIKPDSTIKFHSVLF